MTNNKINFELKLIRDIIFSYAYNTKRIQVLNDNDEEIKNILKILKYKHSKDNNYYLLEEDPILNLVQLKDLDFIVNQTNCKYNIAFETYIKFNYDFMDSIIEIEKQ